MDFERHKEKKIPANIQKGADASVLESQARKADVESKKESCVQKCEVDGRVCQEVLGCAAVAQLVLDRIQHRISQVQQEEPLSENLEIH